MYLYLWHSFLSPAAAQSLVLPQQAGFIVIGIKNLVELLGKKRSAKQLGTTSVSWSLQHMDLMREVDGQRYYMQ